MEKMAELSNTKAPDIQTGEREPCTPQTADREELSCEKEMPAEAVTAAGEEADLAGLFCRKVILPAFGMILAGLLYLVWFQKTGFGIPCAFRLITGYLCPGCGITRALSLVFQFKFREAFSYNALSITVFPILCVYLLYRRIMEAVFRKPGFAVWEYVFLIAAFAITVVYGVVRNL